MNRTDRDDVLTPALIESVGGPQRRTWPALSDAADDDVVAALDRTDTEGLGTTIGSSASGNVFLDPNALGKFFKLQECGRFFKYELEDEPPQSGRPSKFYSKPTTDAGMNLVAQQIGLEFESAVEASLGGDSSPLVGVDCSSDGDIATLHPRLDGPSPATDGGEEVEPPGEYLPASDGEVPPPPPPSSPVNGEVTVDHHGDLLLAAIHRLADNPDARPLMFSQLHVAGMVSALPASGMPDLVFVIGRASGVDIYILDIKAAAEERPHHWIQVAAYAEALDWWLSEVGPEPDCSVRLQGGIIDRNVEPDDITSGNVRESLPSFDLETVRSDLRSKCAADGPIRELIDMDTADVPYRVDDKCGGCDFVEECVATAVEDADLGLLGLSEGVQQQLAGEDGNGVEDLYDLADIADVSPDDNDEFSPPEFDLTDAAETDVGDGQALFHHVQQAGQMATEFYDRVQEAHLVLDEIEERAAGREQKEQVDGRAPYWRHGVEGVPLPNDTPPEDWNVFEDSEFNRGQLVRVYLDVQTDDAYDRVAMVSATVTATDADESVSISQVVPDVDSDVGGEVDYTDGSTAHTRYKQKALRAARYERVVLDAFLNGGRVEPEDDPDVGLFEAIRRVAQSATPGGEAEAPVHLYLYHDDQREALREATVAWGESPTEYQQTYDAQNDPTVGSVRNAAILRDVLDYREEIERAGGGESMVTVVADVLKRHSVVPLVGDGLTTVWGELDVYPPAERASESVRYTDDQFTYLRDDGVEVDLRDAFSFRFFDRTTVAENGRDTPTGLEFDPTADEPEWFPSQMRRGADLPVEYIWAATNRDFGPDEQTSDSRVRYRYELYRQTGEVRLPLEDADDADHIRREDLGRLGEMLCRMCAHVEGAMADRLGDHKIAAAKSSIDFETFPTRDGESHPPSGVDLPLGSRVPSLRQVGGEYLDLEHEAAVAEAEDYFSLATWQRILTGQALVVEVTEVEPGPNDTGYNIRGRVPVDELRPFFGDRAEEIPDICRFKDAQGSGSGSWVTANRVGAAGTSGYDTLDPLLRDGLKPSDKPDRARDGTDQEWIPDDPGRAQYLRNGASAEIEWLQRGEGSASVRLRTHRPIYINRPRISDFLSPGASWTTTSDDSETLHVASGDWLVLDDQSVSGYPEGRMAEILESGRNPLGEHLARVGGNASSGGVGPTAGGGQRGQTRFDPDHTEAALEAVRGHHGASTLPSEKQAALSQTLNSQVAVLQGPPGTGKTDGTLAPALVARTAGAVGGSPGRAFVGSVVAPSNIAVDEVFNAVGGVVTSLADADALPTGVDDARYVRLVGGVSPMMADELPDNEQVGYLAPTDQLGLTGVDDSPDGDRYAEIVNRVAERAADGPASRVNPVVLFGTQSRILSFLDDVAKALESRGFVTVSSSGPAAEGTDESDRSASAGDIVNEGLTPLDFVVADEGSMLKMPQLLTVGAFVDIDGGGQVVVGGDHRQLPPVHRHEWADETRRTIKATAPHASALDWMRLVDEDERAAIEDTPDEAERIGVDLEAFAFGGGDIPFIRLEQTRRNARTIADFLREGVYSADGIDFRAAPPADEHPTVPAASLSDGVAAATTTNTGGTVGGPPSSDGEDGADVRVEDRTGDAPLTDQTSVSDFAGEDVDDEVRDGDGDDNEFSPTSSGADAAPRLSLVVLGGGRSRQANPAEAEIVNAMLAAFEAAADGPAPNGGDSAEGGSSDVVSEAAVDAGVVAPHNAQRSLIRSMVRSRAPGGEDEDEDEDDRNDVPLREEVKVETTERFQGGERDVVMLSATAADPDYVSSRGDFVLDPRRLTVAMSRARRQLTVVANRSVFNAVPDQPESYANAALWKRLRAFVGDTPDWEGTVGDLVATTDGDGDGGILADEHADINAAVFTCAPRFGDD